jgi:hypothetical protein
MSNNFLPKLTIILFTAILLLTFGPVTQASPSNSLPFTHSNHYTQPHPDKTQSEDASIVKEGRYAPTKGKPRTPSDRNQRVLNRVSGFTNTLDQTKFSDDDSGIERLRMKRKARRNAQMLKEMKKKKIKTEL